MRIETLLALKAFITTLDGGQSQTAVTELMTELDTEITLRTLVEHERIRRVFRAGSIVDVVTLENSVTPPPAPEGATS